LEIEKKNLIWIFILILLPYVMASQTFCNNNYCLNVDDSSSSHRDGNDRYDVVASFQEESVFISSNDDYTIVIGNTYYTPRYTHPGVDAGSTSGTHGVIDKKEQISEERPFVEGVKTNSDKIKEFIKSNLHMAIILSILSILILVMIFVRLQNIKFNKYLLFLFKDKDEKE